MPSLSSLFNLSTVASVLMCFYIVVAGWNLYQLMYPLAQVDVSTVPINQLVHPLWSTTTTSSTTTKTSSSSSSMYLRVFLATRERFHMNFFQPEFVLVDDEEDDDGNDNSIDDTSEAPKKKKKKKLPPSSIAVLWDEEISSPAFSKSFLLSSLDCHGTTTSAANSNDDQQCSATDASHQFSTAWLDKADQIALERGEGGVVATLSAAGQGMESTSVLLTLYQSLATELQRLLSWLGLADPVVDPEQRDWASLLERRTVYIPPRSELWRAVQANSTLYVHVVLLRKGPGMTKTSWPPPDYPTTAQLLQQAARTNSILTGGVGMVKYDIPHHIHKPRRYLYRDVLYFWNKYVMHSRELPPWIMEITKPEETAAYKTMLRMKDDQQTYPYWKPEVAIKYVNEKQSYPYDVAGLSGMPVVSVPKSAQHPTGVAFAPVIHVDEIGLTLDKYIPLNETVTTLPLRISFDRSDLEDAASQTKTSTATAGGMSPARWRLLNHLSHSLEAQQELGFEQSDIDEVRTLIADTNVTLLAITMLASALHLLFEFLTFKNEVSFWQDNQDLTGLSVRALFMDMFGQIIILFYLMEQESSLLVTVPAAVGCLIAVWKCRKAAGLQFVKARTDQPVQWFNILPRLLVGYELRATRLELRDAAFQEQQQQKESKGGDESSSTTTAAPSKKDLTVLSMESDRLATRTLGVALLPLVVGYTLYSLLYEEHKSWLSWLITSASSGVYTFGFVMMTPQLFLNWKLKSVAHLPWRVLIYKSLNTFIDDLFSFIIRMPTMARISCFRDDVVFFIYLYQRWLYPVDRSRPAEGFAEMPEEDNKKKEEQNNKKGTKQETAAAKKKKKNQ